MAITELTIDRARWGTSALLNKDGTMCCLGFLSKACGVPDEWMLNVSFPRRGWASEFDVNIEFVRLDVYARSPADAAKINDSNEYSKEQKETMLIDLFARNGITLSFIGEHRSE